MIKNFIVPILIASLIFPATVFANPPEAPTPPIEETTSSFTLELKFDYSLLKAGTTFTPTEDMYILTPPAFAKIYTDWNYRERRFALELD